MAGCNGRRRVLGPQGVTEPAALIAPRKLSLDEWTAAAQAAARFSLAQSAKGKARARLGFCHGHDLTRANAALALAPRCTAETRTGARCRSVCVRGSDRCRRHEGVERAPWSAAAGRQYLGGKLRRPAGRYKTHPSALAAAAGRDGGS